MTQAIDDENRGHHSEAGRPGNQRNRHATDQAHQRQEQVRLAPELVGDGGADERAAHDAKRLHRRRPVQLVVAALVNVHHVDVGCVDNTCPETLHKEQLL